MDTGFMFRYPKDLNMRDQHLTPDPECKGCGGIGRGLYISIATNSAGLTAMAYAKQENVEPYPANIISPQPAYIANYDAVVMDGFMGAGAPGITAYIRKYNTIIKISFEGVGDNTAHAILSTFSFL